MRGFGRALNLDDLRLEDADFITVWLCNDSSVTTIFEQNRFFTKPQFFVKGIITFFHRDLICPTTEFTDRIIDPTHKFC